MQDRTMQGFYLIGVVADELEMHPQTLRKYEQAGFLTPQRMGTLRLYSDEDMERLKVIKHFVEGLGLNIAGVEVALNMTTQLLQLRARLGAKKETSDSDNETIAEVDQMLTDLGLRVADVKTPEPQRELPPPQMPSFEFRPGQTLRFVMTRES